MFSWVGVGVRVRATLMHKHYYYYISSVKLVTFCNYITPNSSYIILAYDTNYWILQESFSFKRNGTGDDKEGENYNFYDAILIAANCVVFYT